MRLQNPLKVVEPLDDVFEQLARGRVFGHKFTARLRGTGRALSFTPLVDADMIVQTGAEWDCDARAVVRAVDFSQEAFRNFSTKPRSSSSEEPATTR